jgi:hypothetical protein
MKKKTKTMCQGCYNNRYNQLGNSGKGECCMFATAKVVKRTSVGLWQSPPYTWAPQIVLSCHRPTGSFWLDKDDPRIKD